MNDRIRLAIAALIAVLLVFGASVVWFAAQARQTISTYRPGADPQTPPPYTELPAPSGPAAAQ
jgi:hypothetical protein